jgi:hypothetical protein
MTRGGMVPQATNKQRNGNKLHHHQAHNDEVVLVFLNLTTSGASRVSVQGTQGYTDGCEQVRKRTDTPL